MKPMRLAFMMVVGVAVASVAAVAEPAKEDAGFLGHPSEGRMEGRMDEQVFLEVFDEMRQGLESWMRPTETKNALSSAVVTFLGGLLDALPLDSDSRERLKESMKSAIALEEERLVLYNKMKDVALAIEVGSGDEKQLRAQMRKLIDRFRAATVEGAATAIKSQGFDNEAVGRIVAAHPFYPAAMALTEKVLLEPFEKYT